ncbi:MAG: diguanylate cyclase, partial [Pseudomonadota bacterium]
GKKVGSGKQQRGGGEEIYVFGQEPGYRDFNGNGWTLIVHVPTKVALAPAFQFRDKIVIVLSAVGIGALLMIFLFSKTVTEPLKKLSKASVEIGKGNLDVEVNIRSKDEIGQLAASFNKMVDDLQEYRDRLTASYEELETKVADRTSELRNANERLQVELTERRRAEEELRKLNRMLRTRSACNQALARTMEEAELIYNICKIIVELGGYRLTWVGFSEQDERKRVRPVAQAGREDGYLRSLDVTWADSEKGRGVTGTAIRTGKPSIINDVLNDPVCSSWRDEAVQRGYASVIGLPLTAEKKAFGAVTIYAGKKDAFNDQEVKLLTELADALSYGIMVLRIRGERMRAEEALRQAKLELEDKVATRTAELSEANEKLGAWVKELEQRNREITTLSNLGDLLQACATPQEAYTVIAQSTKQLFPFDSGALFIFGESRNLLDAVAVWGDTPPDERLFTPDDCWALRRGRPYMIGDMQTGLLCGHVHRRDDVGAYLCVPMMAQGEALGILHVLVRHPEGSDGWERLLEARQRLAPSGADHIALTVANLKLRETLRSLSLRDPLTGLFNRRYMEESVERELRRADRKGTSVGIIMIDIDHFKKVNDTYGHEAGDTVLREMGVLLQRHIRGSDIACRYGGEEFTLILTDSPLSVAQHRAEHLREEIKELHIQHQGQDLGTITLSLGVASFPQNGTTEQALLQAADLALYRAKAEGRDRVVVI